MDDTNTLLLPAELVTRYGPFLREGGQLKLDPTNVPDGLHKLLHYASFWGIADDAKRESLVLNASDSIRANLVEVVRHFDDELDTWLAGDEADNPSPSDEYVAFSAMRMAADFA